MGSMIRIDENGRFYNGIDLSDMVMAFRSMSKKNPNAKMDVTQSFVCVEKGYGDAWIVPSHGEVSARTQSDDKDFFLLPAGTTLQLQHNDSAQSWSFQVFPSGFLLSRQGIHQPFDQAPQISLGQQLNNDLTQEAYNWIYEGDLGMSSMCVVGHIILKSGLEFDRNLKNMTPAKFGEQIPRDNSDWDRMARMLAYIPEIESKIDEMRDISDNWEEVLDNSIGQSIWEKNIELAKIRVAQEKSKTNKQTDNVVKIDTPRAI